MTGDPVPPFQRSHVRDFIFARPGRYMMSVAQDLRAHPLHVLLSVVALSIGVLAIVLTVVSGAIARDIFMAKEEQRTARATTYAAAVTISPSITSIGATGRAMAAGLEATGGTAVVTTDMSGAIGPVGSKLSLVNLHVYWGNYPGLRRLPVLAGGWPSADPLPPAIVVNAATGLRAGDQVMVRLGTSRPEVRASVAAVIADGSDDPAYYLPGAACERFLECRPATAVILLHTTTSRDGCAAYLTRFPEVTADSVDRFDSTASIEEQLKTLQTVFAVCGVAALVVSAIGLINLGLATIRYRSRELSIRRAIGATRRDIALLVLGSSVATGLLGAGLAIAVVAVGMDLILPHLIDPATGVQAPGLPWSALWAATAAGLATSILGALAPAARAVRVDIASVLRD
jgi:putative ABC transport system permease protein